MSCFHPDYFVYTDDEHGYWLPGSKFPPVGSKWTYVPCKKCVGCKIDASRETATRLQLESTLYPENYFVTLTYNDDSLKYSDGRAFHSDPFDSSVVTSRGLSVPTLFPRDIQLFNKKVRKHCSASVPYLFDSNGTPFKPGIRFYMCGEYGPKNLRPHYHIIFLNLHLPDLEKLYINKNGNQVYRSEILEKCWSEVVNSSDGRITRSLGFVTVGDVTFRSCAYVSRYVNKKLFEDSNDGYFRNTNALPPYVNMSRRPGIGFYWLINHFDVFDYSSIPLDTGNQFNKAKIPKYFYDKLKGFDYDRYLEVKESNFLKSKEYLANVSSMSDIPFREKLLDDERRFLKTRYSMLKRNL